MVVEKPAPIESDPLHAVDAPVPEPGRGEILVRVRTCGCPGLFTVTLIWRKLPSNSGNVGE